MIDLDELIAEGHKWLSDFGGGYQDYPGGPMRKYDGVDLIRNLTEALVAVRDAVPDAATELSEMRKMVAEAKQNPDGVEWQTFWDRLTEDQIIELLDGVSIARAERDAALEHIRVTAKANARWRRLANKTIRDEKGERDAALAAIERVAVEIEAVAGGITSSSEAAGYRNGLLRAAQIVRAALDGAPEPEEKP